MRGVAWLAASSALVMTFVACRSATTNEEHVDVDTTETNLSSLNRQKANAFMDDAAVSWVSKDDWGFVQGGRCVMSCHTTVPYMLVAGSRAQHADAGADAAASSDAGANAALATVRGHVETRVGDWATLAPLYNWVPKDSRGLESILNAFALVATDAASGALSSSAEAALENMWAEQNADGSFPWWTTFTLAPWENGESGVWGAALAEHTVGLAPASYVANMTAAEKTKLSLLETWLRTKASSTTVPLHNRAMILLASSHRPTLLTSAQKTTIADAIRAKQAVDGSWPASSLGFTVSGGATAGSSSHAYATAYFAYVLAENADAADTALVTKARQWLDMHQRNDGAWEAKSLNAPTDDFNNQLMTEAATAWAILASGR